MESSNFENEFSFNYLAANSKNNIFYFISFSSAWECQNYYWYFNLSKTLFITYQSGVT